LVTDKGPSAKPIGLLEPHLIDDLAYKETFYWWHRVRRENLYRLLGQRIPRSARVLEIGCGTGANLREGSQSWATRVGIDLEMHALAYCRDLLSVQADAAKELPFSDRAFHAVFMLDVLEHLIDPTNLIRETGRVLGPSGVTVIMVPARPELWSYWDEMHGHQRRYTKSALAEVFGDGWRLEALEYSFSWMYPVVWVFRRFMQGRRRPRMYSDFIEIPKLVNDSLVAAGRFEGWMQRYVPAPCGTTLCGVLSRDGDP
jgi:SAM-dependent methyltransferase